MYSAAIFDFDDTLIKSIGDRPERLVEALIEFGCSFNRRDLHLRLGGSFYEMVIAVCPQLSRNFDDFIDFYISKLREAPPASEPNIEQHLRKIGEGRILIVHSSSHSKLIEVDLESIGVLSMFSHIFGSDIQPKSKPDLESLDPVFGFLRDRSVSFSEVVYIGDSVADFLTAKQAGLEFFATTYFRDNGKELLKAGLSESKIFSSLDEVSRQFGNC